MKKFFKNKKNIIKLIIVVLLLIVIGVLVFVYFNKNNDNKTIKKGKTTTTTTTTTKKPVTVIDENSKSRPYAVMINNNRAVWGYQAGLQDAYIAYEMIVEGGITRMMALFKDKDTERIASVRSSRHYYLDYVLENDAIYAHIGWSPRAQSDISSLKINNINADNSNAFTWDNNLRRIDREHRAYTTMARLKENAQKRGYRTTTDQRNLLKYDSDPVDFSKYEGVIPANTIKIPFSRTHTTSFIYDPENKVYKRYQNGIEHKDYVTGNIYTVKNIITYKVYNYTLNDGYVGGRQDLKNIGSGEGYYISEGNAVPITWEKTARGTQTVYKIKSTGEELVVNDGNTHIEIEPQIETLTIE